ncbi:MAG: hypothetical protein ACREAG_01310 [Nitrosopumilaceae archaeon]
MTASQQKITLSKKNTNDLLVHLRKEKDTSKVTKKENFVYRISDDQEIENLMRYYKLESPDALLKYIKMHGLTKNDADTILTEKKS